MNTSHQHQNRLAIHAIRSFVVLSLMGFDFAVVKGFIGEVDSK